jgi:glycerophosphoryl diester phosphodiesterase
MKRVPAVLAHRGAARAAPENTVAAFRAAAALGADGVELVVRRAADGALVVHHDPIGDHPLAPDVPTLVDALDAVTGVVNIEVKGLPTEPDYDADHGVAREVARVVAQREMHDRVIVSSFDTDALDCVRATDARIRTGWLTLPGFAVEEIVKGARARGYDAIHPERRALLAHDAVALVALAHDAGLAVNTWTVDDPDEMRALADAAVDAIITNVPDRARDVLGRPA